MGLSTASFERQVLGHISREACFLRCRRWLCGMSRAALAQATGILQGRLARMERGACPIDAASARTLGRALRCAWQQLRSPPTPPTPPPAPRRR